MSVNLDARIASTGTRFLVFAQPRFLPSFADPETITVSIPAGEVLAGPADGRMYVLDAPNKTPYGNRPYHGPKNPPVPPGPDGHFDHLTDYDSREFSCATMYATVRRVLDIWEDYFGRRIDWQFRLDFEQLELIPLINWDNAHSGYGFLEFGFGRTASGSIDPARPYCQNFDVLAHELGHSLIFAVVGIPPSFAVTDEYWGFHESAGDLVALVSMLHSHKAVDHLLHASEGNLFSANELSRVGELSTNRQIRNAFNYERMSTVSSEEHDLSQPLTGAIFDIFVEVYQKALVAAGLISQDLADRSFNSPLGSGDAETIQAEFREAYASRHTEFKNALLAARDYLGRLLAGTWSTLEKNNLSYAEIALDLMRIDREIADGNNESTIRECFRWREIALPAHTVMLQTRTLSHCGLQLRHGWDRVTETAVASRQLVTPRGPAASAPTAAAAQRGPRRVGRS